ncbi:MAG TPA: NAD(P)-dependent oxidoreductase [Bacteroidia bacterium]|jgi:UDP-glucose 4-epimerase|nr:NAD(P)-dependent oxidoreductase [Bacteroidia bacterium]
MIIVTGATGFVGFYLVNQLKSEGFKILAVDIGGKEEADYFKKNGIDFVQFDITKESEFEKLPKTGVDAFINLACVQPANMPDEVYDPAKYVSVNILGVTNIFKYCQKNNIKKVLHTISHRNVQGLWEKGEVINEESPRAIKFTGKYSMFSISESAAADIIEYFNQDYGMNGIIFRLPSVYGYGHHESFFKDGKVVKTGLGVFIDNAINGETFEIWGDKNKGRDVVYVKDVVSAIVLALKSKQAKGMYNIASGKKLSLQQQVDDVIKVFSPKDKPSKIVYLPEKPNSVDPCVYDISKAKRELGWEPKYSFVDILADYKKEMESGKWEFLLKRKKRMVNEN